MTACTYQKIKPVDPSMDCSASIPDTISFSADIIPLLSNNCSLTACHSGIAPAGGLNLEPSKAYQQLSKKGSGYIDTINPRRSVLYSSLVSLSQPMPPDGKLDECKIELIRVWMVQKARNN